MNNKKVRAWCSVWVLVLCVVGGWHCGPQLVGDREGAVAPLGEPVTGGMPDAAVADAGVVVADTGRPVSPQEKPVPAPEPVVSVDAGSGPERVSQSEPVLPDVSTLPEPSAPPERREPPQSTCSGKGQKSGVFEWSLKHDGVTRKFTVFIPPQYNGSKLLPVMLNFHGLSMSGGTQELLTGMHAQAAKSGFIAVHPNGRGIPQSWNGGLCCSPASSLLKSKDVDFVRKVLDMIESKLCVDKKRIYATGISNGAYISYRLACELSDRIAAIAPVAGIQLISPCRPKRPMSVIAFHGTADAIVPFEGRKIIGWPSVQDSVGFWVKHNGCRPQPKQVFSKGDTTCNEYSGCQGGTRVRLCVTKGGGHTWPGGFPVPGLGVTTKDINATEVGWSFLSQSSLP